VGRRRLGRGFYQPDPLEVAPLLLGKVVVRADGRSGRILEVEAYRGGDDPASHAYRGPSKRTTTMWGPPGHLYVYFTYGMHWCANVVCGPAGSAGAVLLRALEPLTGLADMRAARWPGVSPDARHRDRDLCRGPARLCQALGIDGGFDGVDLVRAPGPLWLVDDGVAPPAAPAVTTRIGLSVGTESLWRWAYPDHPGVSPWWRPPGPISLPGATSPRGKSAIMGTRP
jgi:DNA-3-methyladenine glycosylase